MVQASRNVLSNAAFWGWALATVTYARAFSYWFRPPGLDDAHTAVIEHVVPYRGWAVVLALSGLLIIVNSIDARYRLIGLAGHVLSVFCYVTFFASIVADAIFYRAPWAGAGTLLLTAVLHFGRLLLIAGSRHE